MRRKQELRKLETTLERLKTKATFYEEQMDYYNRYIETCLDNLAGKETMYVVVFIYLLLLTVILGGFFCEILCVSFLLRSRSKEKKKQDGFKTAIKYSAQKLAEKGVVLEIEGLPKNQ